MLNFSLVAEHVCTYANPLGEFVYEEGFSLKRAKEFVLERELPFNPPIVGCLIFTLFINAKEDYIFCSLGE